MQSSESFDKVSSIKNLEAVLQDDMSKTKREHERLVGEMNAMNRVLSKEIEEKKRVLKQQQQQQSSEMAMQRYNPSPLYQYDDVQDCDNVRDALRNQYYNVQLAKTENKALTLNNINVQAKDKEDD